MGLWALGRLSAFVRAIGFSFATTPRPAQAKAIAAVPQPPAISNQCTYSPFVHLQKKLCGYLYNV